MMEGGRLRHPAPFARQIGLHHTAMSFSVAPLRNLSLPDRTKIPFGSGFFLQDVPQWVKDDKGTRQLSQRIASGGIRAWKGVFHSQSGEALPHHGFRVSVIPPGIRNA
jgi:hypothetical protein